MVQIQRCPATNLYKVHQGFRLCRFTSKDYFWGTSLKAVHVILEDCCSLNNYVDCGNQRSNRGGVENFTIWLLDLLTHNIACRQGFCVLVLVTCRGFASNAANL